MKQYRYKNDIPDIEYNSAGFPSVFCDPKLQDWEKLKWLRYGSGGHCDARHCFVDDWRLEHLWRKQGEGMAKAILQNIMTAPDFSVEKDFPQPLAMYQIWRSLSLAKLWQNNGVTVVPVLQWGGTSLTTSIQEGSVVAVRGPQKGTEIEWLKHAEKLQHHLKPSIVLHFGRKIKCWDNPLYIPLNQRIFS